MNTMVGRMSKAIKRIPLHYWILAAIMLLGILLRTYQFRDWMTFNPDQARDALLVQDMFDGKHWPLLGPQAGNTLFKLGPIFYYFEFASAWLFGASAEKMAYTDLFFSVGAILLAYYFFKKFFKENIALTLTFLFSVSFFVVTYSRFAFNPNSIPFFTLLFLFALFQIVDNTPKEKLFPAALLGAAMGIGFQLHTLLFIAMPLLAVLTLGYLLIKKNFIWKSILVTLLFFFLFNAGQLLYEVQNNGANMRAFFMDVTSSTESAGRNYMQDLSNDVLCHIQGSTYIISSLGSGDKCDLTKLASRIEKKGFTFNATRIAVAVIGSFFTLGGVILFYYYAKKENDPRRKHAYVLVAAYSVIIFIILFPVSSSVSIRYFIVVEFLPFLFVGFWLRFVLGKPHHSFSFWLVGLLCVLFAGSNFLTIKDAVVAYRNRVAGTDNVAIFGEVELMSKYLLENSNGSKLIYLAGKKAYLSRYGKPLEYFAKQQGVVVSKAYKTDKLTASDPFFYVLKDVSQKKDLPEVVNGFASKEARMFGNVTIIHLMKKP